MSLKHVDIGAALRRLADRRIEEAMAEGKFSNLSGAGKPLDLEPMPADEETRLKWWALRILRQNDVTPDEIVLRKAIDAARSRLSAITDETKLESAVRQLNAMVRRLNTLGTNAIAGGVAPVDLDAARDDLRARRAGGSA